MVEVEVFPLASMVEGAQVVKASVAEARASPCQRPLAIEFGDMAIMGNIILHD